ncbi:MAG: hypothetical protein OEZ47_11315 [Gammaproteobacteria bacterium]|nr:hypothetical protein [Gammaproteobacteria bacterium]
MKNLVLVLLLGFASFQVVYAEEDKHMTSPHSMGTPHSSGMSMPDDMFKPPANSPVFEGTAMEVISMQASGYTYVHVQLKDKTEWVAGTNDQIKKGDKVSYDENAVMTDFQSRSLNRKFDRLVFASRVTVVK